MKMTTRISLFLLIAVLCTITLASAQDVILTSAPTAHHNAADEALPRSKDSSDPAGFSGSSVNRAMPGPWTFHLVAQLVKRPELNRRQMEIILDAISVSTSGPFAASSDTGAINAKANALQDLRRRALVVFPKNEITDLFDNVNNAQSDQEILKKYYDLSALQLKGRKASFRRASANEKSVLWRTHFVLYFIKHPELNESQKEIILSAMSLATPDYFAVPSSSPDWKAKVRQPSRSLENKILAAFPVEEAAKIFATLGDNTEAAIHGPYSPTPVLLKSVNYEPLDESGTYLQWTHTRFTQAVPENACTCSTVSDFCPIWSVCRSNGCSETQSGCGALWSYPCNGGCQ